MSYFGFNENIEVIEYDLIFSHTNDKNIGRGWYLMETTSEKKSQFFQTRDTALLALEEDNLVLN